MSKKEDIIKAAAELLQIQGYHATGINEIIEKSGCPRGSLYYYFKEGKDEIVKEALLYSGNEISTILNAAAEAADSPESFVSSVFQGYKKILVDSKYRLGCPVATTALETSGINTELDRTIRQIYSSWEEIIQRKIGAKKKETAGVLISLMEGALISSKIQKSPEPLRIAEKTAIYLLK